MRLGASVFRWDGDPELFALRHTQSGYRSAYCPQELSAGSPQNRLFREALAKRDIRLAEVGAWGSNPLSLDEQTASRSIEYLTQQLALADELGAATCVSILGTRCDKNWYGPHADNYTPDFFAQGVQVARRVLRAVNPKHTTLSFEIMPYSFLDSPEEYLRFLDAVGDERVRVHLDPCNCINNPRLYYENAQWMKRMIPMLGNRIVSVHLKDLQLKPEPVTVQFQEVPIGMGNLDYPTLLRELAKLDGDLPVMLEHLPDEAAYAASAQKVRQLAHEAGVEL